MNCADLGDLLAFLTVADLTLSGLDAPGVRLWLLRDEHRVIGTTALSNTHQVRLFRSTGQLEREVAWSQRLDPSPPRIAFS